MRALKTKMVFMTAHVDGYDAPRNLDRQNKLYIRTCKLFDENCIISCMQYKEGKFHSKVLGVKLNSEEDIEVLATLARNSQQTKILYCNSDGIGRRFTLRDELEDTSRLLGPCIVSREIPEKYEFMFIPDDRGSSIGTYFHFDKQACRTYKRREKELKERQEMFEEM